MSLLKLQFDFVAGLYATLYPTLTLSQVGRKPSQTRETQVYVESNAVPGARPTPRNSARVSLAHRVCSGPAGIGPPTLNPENEKTQCLEIWLQGNGGVKSTRFLLDYSVSA